MKKFSDSMDDDFVYEFEDHVELMFCNLVQIVTCVRYLEQIIRIDNIRQTVLQVSTSIYIYIYMYINVE